MTMELYLYREPVYLKLDSTYGYLIVGIDRVVYFFTPEGYKLAPYEVYTPSIGELENIGAL